jgi:antitoxin component HigA of HigAB toxin-antitoxin module
MAATDPKLNKLIPAWKGLRDSVPFSDLRKEVGTQGVVSEILSGTRKINARQAKSLARRFGVSPAVSL